MTDASVWCEHACKETEFIKPQSEVVNPPCCYCDTDYREFEKTVKRYDLSDGSLTIGRRVIDTDNVDYLEIDGRVIIDEGESR